MHGLRVEGGRINSEPTNVEREDFRCIQQYSPQILSFAAQPSAGPIVVNNFNNPVGPSYLSTEAQIEKKRRKEDKQPLLQGLSLHEHTVSNNPFVTLLPVIMWILFYWQALVPRPARSNDRYKLELPRFDQPACNSCIEGPRSVS